MSKKDLDKTILMPSIASEIKKEKRKDKKIITKIIIALFIIGSSFSLFLFYGPIDGFRNFWITSAMTSMSHQYLATWFYNDDVINEVLSNNHIIEVDENTNPDLINFKDYDSSAKIYKNEYEKQILTKDPGNDLYKVIEVSGSGYQGYLVAIYDPSRVSIATTAYLGKRGEAITTVAKRENAIVAINAGGFYDPDWNSNGALPHGTVIKDGKIVSDLIDEHLNNPDFKTDDFEVIDTTDWEYDSYEDLTSRIYNYETPRKQR